jgi:hypothetical protein
VLTSLAAATEARQGWAGPIALIAALAVFRLLQPLMHRIGNRSPTPPSAGGVKPITAGRLRFTRVDPSRDTTRGPAQTGRDPRADTTRQPADTGVDTDPAPRATTFPARDTSPEPGWFGRRIRLPDGSSVVRSALHIARTGDSPPPEPEPELRDDFDDALDLVAEPEPDELDDWLAWAAEKDIGYNERVRRAMARFGDSESKIKRRIRELKDEEDET